MKFKINKNKLVMSITIGIACFALMLVMFMQFKVVKQTDITAIETMRESELRLELSSWNTKYQELDTRYQDVLSKIEEYKTERVSDAKTAELLQKELQQLNESLGKTDVTGEGIVIQLIDKAGTQLSEDVPVLKITEEDLLLIINNLFAAGAEAVSLNGSRIISVSSIFEISDQLFIVNGKKKVSSPFVINAIGNPDYLKSAVSGKGGHVDALAELGHETKVDENNKITIEKYEKDLTTKYIK